MEDLKETMRSRLYFCGFKSRLNRLGWFFWVWICWWRFDLKMNKNITVERVFDCHIFVFLES